MNIWSSGFDGMSMKEKNMDDKMDEKKWMMDMAWFCMRFRRILGIYHLCQIKDR